MKTALKVYMTPSTCFAAGIKYIYPGASSVDLLLSSARLHLMMFTLFEAIAFHKLKSACHPQSSADEHLLMNMCCVRRST